jgi:hypothetical protein
LEPGKPEIALLIDGWIQYPSDQPNGLALANFRKDDAAGECLIAIGPEEANSARCFRWQAPPPQVGHEFVAAGEPDTLPLEHIPPESAPLKIIKAGFIAEKSIGI